MRRRRRFALIVGLPSLSERLLITKLTADTPTTKEFLLSPLKEKLRFADEMGDEAACDSPDLAPDLGTGDQGHARNPSLPGGVEHARHELAAELPEGSVGR